MFKYADYTDLLWCQSTFKVWRDIWHVFCCKFHGEYDKEKIENRSTFVKLINKCIVAHFLLRHGVYLKLLRDQGCRTTYYAQYSVCFVCLGPGGVLTEMQKGMINAFLRRIYKYRFVSECFDLDTIMDDMDRIFLKMFSPAHCLHLLLPPAKSNLYGFRSRDHNLQLLVCNLNLRHGCQPPSWKKGYDVITPPPIARLLRNSAGRCKMTCRWLHIRYNQNGNRIPIWRPSVFRNRK